MTQYKDRRQELIWDWQREIIEIYEKENLKNLSGLDLSFNYNGRQVLKWYFDTVRQGMNRNINFDFQRWIDDVILIVDEILYFTASLYLYRPYMNSPLEEGELFNGKMLYPNRQNLESKRYEMFSNILFEKIYNYWDRVGDLIAAYFPGALPAHRIYFSTILQAIPAEFKTNEPYLWLLNFNDNEFKDLNKKRKDIVHHITLPTSFKYEHLEHCGDREQIERILDERYKRADFAKENLTLCLQGFEKVVEFIEIINTIQPDIES